MREVSGEFASAYHRRKGRLNASWGDNYHATVVEEGRHLWECLCWALKEAEIPYGQKTAPKIAAKP